MIYFTDWRLDATGDILARQYDNQSRTLTISGALPEGWVWDLLVRAGDAMDIWALEVQEGGIGCTLTAEMLAVSGYYTVQLRGTQGEKVRHTNTIRVFIPESLSGDAHWPEIPTAFSDAVAQAEGAADRAEDAAQAAEDAAAHYPYPDPDTGTWWVWDPEKSEYTDSGEPYSGGGGGQGQDGGYYFPTVDTNGILTWTASKSDMPQAESANVKGTPGKDGADGAPGKDGTNGVNGITPTIGDNGNWFLADTDTGKPSRGPAGQDGAPGAKGDPGKDGAGMDVTGASIGQIVKIAAVDENGKPTAWAPVDMPSGGGGGGEKEWELLADVTLAEDVSTIKVTAKPDGTSFSVREAFLIGKPVCDGVVKDLQFGTGDAIGYGKQIISLGEILTANDGVNVFISSHIQVMPESIYIRTQCSEYNSFLGYKNILNASNIRDEAIAAYSTLGDPITKIVVGPWSKGTAGLLKAGTTLRIYGR